MVHTDDTDGDETDDTDNTNDTDNAEEDTRDTGDDTASSIDFNQFGFVFAFEAGSLAS